MFGCCYCSLLKNNLTIFAHILSILIPTLKSLHRLMQFNQKNDIDITFNVKKAHNNIKNKK